MQDIVEALCGMTQESFRARCECREGDVVVSRAPFRVSRLMRVRQ